MMKLKIQLLLLICLGAGAGTATAQNIDTSLLPRAVKTRFYQENKSARDVKWKQIQNNYQVAFEVNDTDHILLFRPDSRIISSQKEIKTNQLPRAVRATIKKQFPGYRIDDADKITKGKIVTYKVELDGNPDLKVWFSENGTVIKKQSDR